MTDRTKTTIVLVTPQMAAEWLKTMTRNRHLRVSHVVWIAEQMKADQWKINGETIKFSVDGELLDGQHRLSAVVMSGKTVALEVRWDVDPKSFDTMDTGARRGIADVLGICGEKSVNLLAATARWVFLHENKMLLANAARSGYNAVDATKILKKHPGIRDSVAWTSRINHSNAFAKLIPTSALAYTYYAMASHDAEKCESFWGKVFGDEIDAKTSVTRLLRTQLVNTKRSGKNTRALEVAALIVKAWSAYCTGKQLLNLRWRRWGDAPESFPLFPGETESRGPAVRKRRFHTRDASNVGSEEKKP